MNICHQYSVTWRYEFNHLKSGVVTFGEAKSVHSRLLTEREWLLDETTVNELCEYKNLGVLKNYIGSFSSNVEDNIEKTRKKAIMIFSSDFDRRKTNPLVYIKFWRQACWPCLLFGTELSSLNASQLGELECCQQWFLKNVFYMPRFAAGKLLFKLANVNSIDLKKLLFFGRLIIETKMPPAVKGLFQGRVDDFFIPASLQLVFYLVFVMHHVNMTCFIISSFGIVIRHSSLTRISHLDRQQKTLLLLGGLSLPFDQTTVTMVNRFICSAVSKFVVLEKIGCVSCRHYDLKSNVIFLCFYVLAYFSALSISYCILLTVFMQSFKFCILHINSCILDFYYFWIL